MDGGKETCSKTSPKSRRRALRIYRNQTGSGHRCFLFVQTHLILQSDLIWISEVSIAHTHSHTSTQRSHVSGCDVWSLDGQLLGPLHWCIEAAPVCSAAFWTKRKCAHLDNNFSVVYFYSCCAKLWWRNGLREQSISPTRFLFFSFFKMYKLFHQSSQQSVEKLLLSLLCRSITSHSAAHRLRLQQRCAAVGLKTEQRGRATRSLWAQLSRHPTFKCNMKAPAQMKNPDV